MVHWDHPSALNYLHHEVDVVRNLLNVRHTAENDNRVDLRGSIAILPEHGADPSLNTVFVCQMFVPPERLVGQFCQERQDEYGNCAARSAPEWSPLWCGTPAAHWELCGEKTDAPSRVGLTDGQSAYSRACHRFLGGRYTGPTARCVLPSYSH
jgi:hypothetical protein